MLLASLRIRRESWKGFHKIASRNVTNTFTVAVRSVELHKEAVLKETYLKWLHCCVFLKNKVIPGTFWSYHAQLTVWHCSVMFMITAYVNCNKCADINSIEVTRVLDFFPSSRYKNNPTDKPSSQTLRHINSLCNKSARYWRLNWSTVRLCG
jgi:hypothetical protein